VEDYSILPFLSKQLVMYLINEDDGNLFSASDLFVISFKDNVLCVLSGAAGFVAFVFATSAFHLNLFHFVKCSSQRKMLK